MSSMQTTETAAQSFAVVRKGFDREQVNSALSRLEAEVELLRADRDSAVERAHRTNSEVERLREENRVLEARIAELGRVPKTTEQMSDRLSTMLSLATAEAESIRDAAHSTADRTLTEAEDEAWRMRETASNELTAIRTRTEAVRAEHTAALEAARTRAKEIIRSAESEAKRLDNDAAERRRQIDEDHRLASDLRREETMKEDQAIRTASLSAAQALRQDARSEADTLVNNARVRAEQLVDQAHAHTEQLRALRDTVYAELATVRARLEPLPGRGADEELLPDKPEFSSNDE